jgi:hypothetical protein
MDILKSVGGWAKQLTEVGISVIGWSSSFPRRFSGCYKHHDYLEWIE